MAKIIDISGETFNQIDVLSVNKPRSGGSQGTYFNCRCRICGKTFVRRGYDIRAGRVWNCGCTKARTEDPRVPRGVKRYLSAPASVKARYGCEYCSDIKSCRGRLPCKYAEILDNYLCYEAYDEEVKKLFESYGLKEENKSWRKLGKKHVGGSKK